MPLSVGFNLTSVQSISGYFVTVVKRIIKKLIKKLKLSRATMLHAFRTSNLAGFLSNSFVVDVISSQAHFCCSRSVLR